VKPGIYVHIPFCEQRCYYCAFTVAVAPADSYAAYVARLTREIELAGPLDSPDTLFFGGGTPSILPAALMEKLLRALPAAGEVSLEANPGRLELDKLRCYRDNGINRISLGAQSFHDSDLDAAGRLHRSSDVVADIENLRRFGFANINLDLIAGLPGQRIELWQKNLDWIERLRPEHLSIYMLELEERSPWSAKNTPEPAADDEFVRFYETASERLQRCGYVHYEISNWALPGFECRHNLKYWTGAPYRGFGVGAHSFAAGQRFWNTASLSEYAQRLDAGQLPLGGHETLTPEMRLAEAFMLGLRRLCGFDIHAVAEQLVIRYPSEWFARVDALRQAGLIDFDGTVLKLTPAGRLVASSITEDLLWPALLSTSGATR
jgi:oxygen-independent coproporphyrinogen III oxidase